MILRTCLLFIVTLTSISAIAETVYIRDVIYVPLRGGQSSEHRILHQGIRSGTELQRLEVNEETGFSRIRGKSGLEGWIKSQYLVTEPIARDRLEAMSNKVVALEAEVAEAKLKFENESGLAEDTLEQLSALETDKINLNTELSRITTLATDTIQINAQNKELQQELSDLSQQIDDLSVLNGELRDSNNQSWYLIGAATIFLGILLGIWFGRQLFGRPDSGWS